MSRHTFTNTEVKVGEHVVRISGFYYPRTWGTRDDPPEGPEIEIEELEYISENYPKPDFETVYDAALEVVDEWYNEMIDREEASMNLVEVETITD